MHILANGTAGYELPTITITGHVSYGDGNFDSLSTPTDLSLSGGGSGTQIAMGILNQKQRALSLANVCTNPAVSANTKQTTGQYDVLGRYLAAMDVFNTIQAAKLLGMYQAAYGSSGIGISISGQMFQGFRVFYADGSTEMWMVSPASPVSSIRLYDNPLPNSLIPPPAGTKGCTGGTG